MAASKSSGKGAGKRTITPSKKGQKPISFQPGGLHASLGVQPGQPIPAAKMAAAKRGDFGPKAQAQANFAANVLTGPKPKAKRKPRKG